MAKTSRKRTRSTSTHRASWRGQLTFGLVSFPVEAVNAVDRAKSDIHFHQLHAKCHSRIRYKKECPIHGEVPNDEIVSGYEYKKGKYVELDKDELEEMRTEEERALRIDAFVTPNTVDPLYFDGRTYYLVPQGTVAVTPYVVFLEAMEKEGRYGIGQMVFSGKDQIVLVRPFGGVLHVAMLNYAAEIRQPKTVAAEIKKPAGIAKQVQLAKKLIEEWSQKDFDFRQYKDTYREHVKELIEAKVKGKEVVAPEEEQHPGVLNLIDALKQSVDTLPKPHHHKRPRRKSA